MRHTIRDAVRRPPSLLLRLLTCCVVSLAITIMGGGLFVLLFHPEITFSSIQPQESITLLEHQPASQEQVFTAAASQEQPNAAAQADVPSEPALQEPELTRIVREIEQGDTPTSLLAEHLALENIYSLCSASQKVYSLEQLRAGHPLVMLLEGEKLVGLEYEIDANERLVVNLQGDNPEIRKESIPYEVRQETIVGTIDGSLWNTMQVLGEQPELIVRLANLFSWDIDFHREIQPGDSFQLIVDKRFRDGKFAGYGDIHAASFTNAGTTYYAFHYTTSSGESGYYDAQGRSLRKDFLRAPLPFLKVSSAYSMNRLHPILGYRRPHQGVDYSAPKGTPIFAVADGTIVERGYNGSQGNFIVLRHAGEMKTVYNHMSKFNPNYQKGTHVKQGAVIGYVGSTGYATGPHLDFRMQIGNKYINPQEYYKKHKTTPSKVLAAKELARFREHITMWQAELQRRATAIAQTQTPQP
ncbi:MAG: peptidoglycan DD-metalloendopeptidase family protein [Desulfomicrobiaceae bacterium]